jgi:hypothetical protein
MVKTESFPAAETAHQCFDQEHGWLFVQFLTEPVRRGWPISPISAPFI